MSGSERVTIRIPSSKASQLQALVDSGEFQSVSDAIRSAIDCFLQEMAPSGSVRKLRVDLPEARVIELEALIREGDSVSMDDAIRNAVREYTRGRVSDAMREG